MDIFALFWLIDLSHENTISRDYRAFWKALTFYDRIVSPLPHPIQDFQGCLNLSFLSPSFQITGSAEQQFLFRCLGVGAVGFARTCS